MKRLFYLFICFSCFCYAQKEYEFDYLLEYEHHFTEGKQAKTTKYYYMTNSKDNTYLAQLNIKDSLTVFMVFTDYNRKSIPFEVPQAGLLKSDNIMIPCQDVQKEMNPQKKSTLKYSINVLKDTLIDGVSYGRYEYRYTNKKREQRKKLYHEIFLIDKATLFHKPVKQWYYWTSDDELLKQPNGITSKKLLLTYDGAVVNEDNLVRYIKIDKKIILMSDCE